MWEGEAGVLTYGRLNQQPKHLSREKTSFISCGRSIVACLVVGTLVVGTLVVRCMTVSGTRALLAR